MIRKKTIAITVPAYNEEKLLGKTVKTLPDFVDRVFIINDASTDKTAEVAAALAKEDKRVKVITNNPNGGIGHSLKKGFKASVKEKNDITIVMPGDAQCDPKYLKEMIEFLLDNKLDFVKANRFMDLKELKNMPRLRRVGNIVVTILTKFATGYYDIFDSQNGYCFYSYSVLGSIPMDQIGERYEFENTILIALSELNAKIADYPVPANYGNETSTINLFGTVMRTLRVLNRGFWRRIYYKYILYNFHPIALFIISGLILFWFGLLFGVVLIALKLARSVTPSTGTVMLSVLPLILGFQLLLTSIILDMNENTKNNLR